MKLSEKRGNMLHGILLIALFSWTSKSSSRAWVSVLIFERLPSTVGALCRWCRTLRAWASRSFLSDRASRIYCTQNKLRRNYIFFRFSGLISIKQSCILHHIAILYDSFVFRTICSVSPSCLCICQYSLSPFLSTVILLPIPPISAPMFSLPRCGCSERFAACGGYLYYWDCKYCRNSGISDFTDNKPFHCDHAG